MVFSTKWFHCNHTKSFGHKHVIIACSYNLIHGIHPTVHLVSFPHVSYANSSSSPSSSSLFQSYCQLLQTCTQHPQILSWGHRGLPLQKCARTEQTERRSPSPSQLRLCRSRYLGHDLEQCQCILQRGKERVFKWNANTNKHNQTVKGTYILQNYPTCVRNSLAAADALKVHKNDGHFIRICCMQTEWNVCPKFHTTDGTAGTYVVPSYTVP